MSSEKESEIIESRMESISQGRCPLHNISMIPHKFSSMIEFIEDRKKSDNSVIKEILELYMCSKPSCDLKIHKIYGLYILNEEFEYLITEPQLYFLEGTCIYTEKWTSVRFDRVTIIQEYAKDETTLIKTTTHQSILVDYPIAAVTYWIRKYWDSKK